MVGGLATKGRGGLIQMGLYQLVSIPGIFLNMFNLLVEIWPQFPLQKHLLKEDLNLLASGLCFGWIEGE